MGTIGKSEITRDTKKRLNGENPYLFGVETKILNEHYFYRRHLPIRLPTLFCIVAIPTLYFAVF